MSSLISGILTRVFGVSKVFAIEHENVNKTSKPTENVLKSIQWWWTWMAHNKESAKIGDMDHN